MNRIEHLFTILAEEASEVAQETSKCLRFGPKILHPDFENTTNSERVMEEFAQMLALMEMLQDEGALPRIELPAERDMIEAKKLKVERLLEYSQQCGTLQVEMEFGSSK